MQICCVADNIKLLHKCNPEEFELTSIMERIIKLENKTEVNAKRIGESYPEKLIAIMPWRNLKGSLLKLKQMWKVV